MSRIHGIFDSEKRPSYADGPVEDTKLFNPNQLIYRLFSPPGTTADISYSDINSEPQQVDGARLPWSLKIPTSLPAAMGNMLAQCDSGTIGCRIVADDAVEKIEVNAFSQFLVIGA